MADVDFDLKLCSFYSVVFFNEQILVNGYTRITASEIISSVFAFTDNSEVKCSAACPLGHLLSAQLADVHCGVNSRDRGLTCAPYSPCCSGSPAPCTVLG